MRPIRIFLAILLCTMTFTVSACVKITGDDLPEWARPTDPTTVTTEETSSPPSEEPSEFNLPTAHHGKEVLMLGRSVMRGWFDHWGWDGHDPYLQDGYAFYYAELDPPPAIADSAVAYIDQVPAGTIVFFKLCFVDFEANSSADVTARLKENVGYVRKVVDAAQARGVPLVLGNSLPRVKSETTPALADLHARYNKELDAIARSESDVYVLDLYDALASNSILPAGLAVSPDDSHLNDIAYQVLDPELFALLKTIPSE